MTVVSLNTLCFPLAGDMGNSLSVTVCIEFLSKRNVCTTQLKCSEKRFDHALHFFKTFLSMSVYVFVQFGSPGQCDEATSHQLINRYVEWGGNFLDTADIYGRGNSEMIVGSWLER